MKRELLRFQDVSKSHRTHEVFRGLSFDVFAGEAVGMLIPPLSGKTTIARILQGDEDYTGIIYFLGRPVKNSLKNLNASGEILCLSRQSPLIPALTIGENIFLMPGYRPMKLIDSKRDNEEAQTYLDALGLNISASELVRNTDLYTRHMAQLAGAIRSGLRLLVFDDPSAYYDREQLESLSSILSLLHKRGIAVLYLASADFPMDLSSLDKLIVIDDYRKTRTIFHPDENSLVPITHIRTPSSGERTAPPTEPFNKTPALIMRGVYSDGLPEINLSLFRGQAIGISSRRILSLQHFSSLFYPESETALSAHGNMVINGRIRRPNELEEDIGVRYVLLNDAFAHDQLLEEQTILDNVYLPVSRARRMGMLSFNNDFRRSMQGEIAARLGISPANQSLPAFTLDTPVAQELVLFRTELQSPSFVIYSSSYTQIARTLQELLHSYFRRFLHTGIGLLLAVPNLEPFSSLISDFYDLDAPPVQNSSVFPKNKDRH